MDLEGTLQSLELRRQGQASGMVPKNSAALRSLKQPSTLVIENGINALDLIDSPPATTASLQTAVAVMQANYGTEYAPEKIALLFDMIRDEGWSEARFNRTLKWFLKNKPFPSWTIADWFSFSVKVYPLEWTYGKSRNEYEGYELPEGVTVYKPIDGVKLPFPESQLYCLSCQMKLPMSAKHTWNFCMDVA